jgi:hypothetical protein
MNQSTLVSILKHAESWADEDREELADYARVIEARRVDLYNVSESERRALDEALAQADQGDFAPDAMLAESAKRYGA